MARDYIAAASHGAMALLFGGAAYVQLNDPDPHVWITVYLMGTCAAMYAALRALDVLPHILLEFALPVLALFVSFPFSLIVRNGREFGTSLLTALASPDRFSVAPWKEFIEVEVCREVSGMLLLLYYMLAVAAPAVFEPAPEVIPSKTAAGKAKTMDQPTSGQATGVSNGTTTATQRKGSKRSGTPTSVSSAESSSADEGASSGAHSPSKGDASKTGPAAGQATAEAPPQGGVSGLLKAVTSAKPSTRSTLAFLGVYGALWAGWVTLLHAGKVDVGAHCQGML